MAEPLTQLGGAVAFPAGVAVGVGVGGAVGGVIEPRLRQIQNVAWRRFQTMPLQAVEAAELVASGERDMEWGIEEATNVGVNEERFRALVDMADSAPDLGTLFELWRRGYITDGEFAEGARKGTIEGKWIAPLALLKRELLTPAQLANAVVQGFRDLDDAADDAELQGLTRADFETMVDVTGLPPGPETLQEWARRGIITEAELAQGIREGHTKTKYIDEYVASLERVLSAPEYAGLWLRGWLTEQEAKKGGALTGFGAEEMELLYKNRGRPATTRQVHIGWQRGGRLPGAATEREAFETAVKQSNIRTEYADLLWKSRYTYPSAFVLRALTADGTFTAAQAEEALVHSGWRPDWAKLAAEKWAGGSGETASGKWADRARARLFTAAHADYMDGNASDDDARALLTAVGATAAEQTTIIGLWNLERERTRRDLTQAQILRLYKKSIWPRERAQAALEDLDLEPGDASDLLDAV